MEQLWFLRKPTARGLSLLQTIQLLSAIGLPARAVFAEFAELALLRTPCIAHLTRGHFIVLLGVGKTAAEIFDPCSGRRIVQANWIRNRFSMYMVEVNGLKTE